MLGADAGSMNIDGFTEGLLDGLTLCVRTLLGFSLGDADSVENGSTDIDGEDEGLIDGPTLVVEVDEGNILDFKDGAIDSDGNPLGSVVGVGLSLGPLLGTKEGSTDIEGVDDGLVDGPILAVGV
eukprot:scaffold41995_cov78-Attheya_sp.AAC.3